VAASVLESLNQQMNQVTCHSTQLRKEDRVMVEPRAHYHDKPKAYTTPLKRPPDRGQRVGILGHDGPPALCVVTNPGLAAPQRIKELWLIMDQKGLVELKGSGPGG
jgi:hypothetical protein